MGHLEFIGDCIAASLKRQLAPYEICTRVHADEEDCVITLFLSAEDFRLHWPAFFMTARSFVPFAEVNWIGIDLEISFTKTAMENHLKEFDKEHPCIL